MARVFVTGSTTGLGLATAAALLEEGHEVVLHARNPERATDLGAAADRARGVVIGDLGDEVQTRDLAEQANTFGPFDAVIHNAGVYAEGDRTATPEGHADVLAVNVLAPYVLTALIRRPSRLIYLSSGMHTGGRASLDDLDWTARPWDGVQAYSDSKLLITTLAAAIARRWPDVHSNSVDPGWVPTRMGGLEATDDLGLGYQTQVWLATNDDRAAAVTGGYWYHGRTRAPAAVVADHTFQDALLHELARITGVSMP